MQMFKSILDQLRLSWRLLRDPRVPLYIKAVPFLPLLYVLSPLDFIPDFIPILGQLDDLTILLLGLRAMEMLAPPELVQEHRLGVERGIYPRQEDIIEGKVKRPER